jgi:uncharacterized protein Veg
MGLEFSSQAEEGKSLEIKANVGRYQREGTKITKRQETGPPETASSQPQHQRGLG